MHGVECTDGNKSVRKNFNVLTIHKWRRGAACEFFISVFSISMPPCHLTRQTCGKNNHDEDEKIKFALQIHFTMIDLRLLLAAEEDD